MPSNLRHDHPVVTSSYFWSRNKDGGHAIRSAEAENPMLHAHFTTLRGIGTELLRDGIFTLRRSRFI